MEQLSISTPNTLVTLPKSMTSNQKRYPFVHLCLCVCVFQVHLLYLFVCMIVGVDVVVKLLVSQVLLVTQLTVEKRLQILC